MVRVVTGFLLYREVEVVREDPRSLVCHMLGEVLVCLKLREVLVCLKLREVLVCPKPEVVFCPVETILWIIYLTVMRTMTATSEVIRQRE